MRLISIALLAGLLLCPAATLAQEETWEDALQVRLEERKSEEEAVEGGLVLVWEARTDVLDEDESMEFEFEGPESEGGELVLEPAAGQEYVVLAVCDDDCADIDLYLSDEEGNEVGADTEVGKWPVIVTDRLEAGYTIEVFMAECAVAPCYFAVGAFYGSAAERTEAAEGD